jgi:hypothetical protein
MMQVVKGEPTWIRERQRDGAEANDEEPTGVALAIDRVRIEERAKRFAHLHVRAHTERRIAASSVVHAVAVIQSGMRRA